jgi:hypothetical protein
MLKKITLLRTGWRGERAKRITVGALQVRGTGSPEEWETGVSKGSEMDRDLGWLEEPGCPTPTSTH